MSKAVIQETKLYMSHNRTHNRQKNTDEDIMCVPIQSRKLCKYANYKKRTITTTID